MPDRIPTTPEQWAAIVPNVGDYMIERIGEACDQSDERVARSIAASRIAEHERTTDEHVERLADHLCNAAFHTRLPDEPCGTCRAEARRILEDR